VINSDNNDPSAMWTIKKNMDQHKGLRRLMITIACCLSTSK